MENKYGYKISFREFGKRKAKLYLAINTLDGAIWNIRRYQITPQYNKKTMKKLNKPFWFLEKVKNLKEYNKLWKGCPFKDDLS